MEKEPDLGYEQHLQSAGTGVHSQGPSIDFEGAHEAVLASRNTQGFGRGTGKGGAKTSHIRESYYREHAGPGTLGLWGTVFAILSTIVGGGMVSLPWATYYCGFIIMIVASVATALQVMLSSAL